MSLQLYEHQNIALPILSRMEKEGRGGFLADACGLGKTITMSTHLMMNKIVNKKDLIVCPLSLMEQWKREIKRVYKDGGRPEPTILFFYGKSRTSSFSKKNWDFVITTYSIIGYGELNRKRWGRVVLDESHNIRNGLQSKKSKCSVAAFEIGKRSIYNWCMSATPFCNRIRDIASQCKFIGTYPYNDPKWWKNNGKNTQELSMWREKFVLRRTKENILPPPKYYDIEVKPTRSEFILVEKLRNEAQEKFERWKRSNGLSRITLQGQIIGLIQRLRVVSNSYYCGENHIDTSKVLNNNAKVRQILEFLDRKIYKDPTNSVIIFSQFTSYLDILEKVIDDKMIGIEVMKFTGNMSSEKRDEVVKDFTTLKYPRVLLISLTAGGCGLNLVPCSTVFIAEPYYNPFLEKQAEERVHRLSQYNQVSVYRFSVTNSVETWINSLKKNKLYLASGLDLVCKYDRTSLEFCFNDLSDLFIDLVGFKNDDRYKKRENRKKKLIPNSPKFKLGIDCSICTEDVGNKGVYNLACGHLYHSRCLKPWLVKKDTCPMCRQKINILR
jgi:transcription termination factor 2